jgi:hypothetical protein
MFNTRRFGEEMNRDYLRSLRVFVEPDLRALALRAWTNAEDMSVLVDRLLETDLIQGELDRRPFGCQRDAHETARAPFTADDGLYWLESAAREWTLDLFDELELRVTGGWPDIFFVVCRNPFSPNKGPARGDATLSRVEFEGVLKQPRLLRRVGHES